MKKYGGMVLLLFLVTVLSGPLATAKLSKEAKDWMNGPVRYLMSKEERKVFKKLEGEEAVEQFKQDFWVKRDPIPETEANEFKIRFEERVAFAAKNFRNFSSDRGMVYILLGPPQERSDNPLGANISQGASELWTYASIKGQRTRTNYSLYFYDHNNNNDHELWVGQDLDPQNTDFKPDGVEPCNIVFTDPKIVGLEPLPEDFQAAPAAPAVTAGAGAVAPSAVPAAPPSASSTSVAYVDRLVNGEEPLTDLQAAHSAYCFKDDKGTTLVVINIGVFAAEKTEDPGFIPFARLVSDTGENWSFESEDSFIPWKENNTISGDYLVYQAKGSVPPGDYKLFGGVYHSGDGTAASFSERLKVPDYQSGAFSLSSVIVADEVKDDASRTLGGDHSAKPFTVGSKSILPNVDHVFTKSQDLSVFFQAYDGQKNPETDQFIYRIQYRFFFEDKGRFRPYGKPVMEESDQPGLGKEWPLQTFRSGKYRLTVKVTDMISETDAKSTVFYELTDEN